MRVRIVRVQARGEDVLARERGLLRLAQVERHERVVHEPRLNHRRDRAALEEPLVAVVSRARAAWSVCVWSGDVGRRTKTLHERAAYSFTFDDVDDARARARARPSR